MAKPEDTALWPDALLLIGCGNMAGAMLARWLDKGLPPERVTVLRPSGKAVAPGVRVLTALDGDVRPGTVVLLGHKPQQLPAIAPELAPRFGDGTLILSILAGVTAAQLAATFPRASAWVRAMPNLPVRTGHGVVSLFADPALSISDRALVDALCAPLGLVAWLEEERLFDAATALAGCGPAYLYRFIDAMASAGSALGLDSALAARMALAMVEGAAVSAAASTQSPAVMADAVASKGGMTREGLDVLDKPEGLSPLIEKTLRAARDRGAELARLAGGSQR